MAEALVWALFEGNVNNDEYQSLFEKAKRFAARFGFGDECEDFAQEYTLGCFNTGKIRKLEWFLSDYSDKLRANKRVLGSPSGYLSKNIRVSLDQPIGNEDDDGSTISDLVGVLDDSVELNSEIREIDGTLESILSLIEDTAIREEIRMIYLNWIEENI